MSLRIRLSFQAIFVALLLSVGFVQMPIVHASPTTSASNGPGSGIQPGQLVNGGKSHQNQDQTFLQRKNQRPLNVQGSQASLNFSPAQYVAEPPYYGTDSAGHGYTDEYMWNFCGPGAATATLGYWGVNLNRGTGTYSDPRTTTTWNDNNYASYVSYLADDTRPPSFGSNGLMTWQGYPNAYAAFNDVRDTLNWEASGHSSNYKNFFYAVVTANNLSLSTFENDIQTDIYTSGRPLIVSVNDSYLPDWPSTTKTSHYITILGYNFNAGTFTYDETCGHVSCNTLNTGIYSLSMSQLYNGMENDNGNGGIIW